MQLKISVGLAVSLCLAACNDDFSAPIAETGVETAHNDSYAAATTPPDPSSDIAPAPQSAATPDQHGGLVMPSPQQKRAMAASYHPSRSIVSMFPPPPNPTGEQWRFAWLPGEEMEARGFLLQYLDSPVGSAAEREGWAGLQRYYDIFVQRVLASQDQVRRERVDLAARIARDEPEVRAICTRFKAEVSNLTYSQALSMRDRLAELAIDAYGPFRNCHQDLRFQVIRLMPEDCDQEPCVVREESAGG